MLCSDSRRSNVQRRAWIVDSPRVGLVRTVSQGPPLERTLTCRNIKKHDRRSRYTARSERATQTTSISVLLLTVGKDAICLIPHSPPLSALPFAMRMYPCSPKTSPQLFFTFQYFWP